MYRQLEDVPKSSIVCDDGRSYAQFRASLRPRWWRVAVDLAFGYVMLAASALLVVISVRQLPDWRLVAIAVGAVLFGFWMAYVQLFLHEAAHFNLCPGRERNDFLGNLLIAVWVGTDLREYRRIHWDHHRFLGQTNDTERSYFSPLGWRFVLESLFLIAALRILLLRRAALARDRGTTAARSPGKRMLVAGLLLHGGLLAACILLGQYELAAAWLAGIVMVYPLFGSLRQLLEHRGEAASAATDYALEPHGKYTRSFTGGPIGSFLGGAGFRYHDIHHFDPELSYTNLPAADAFLARAEAARASRVARRSYASVLRELWRQ